MTLHVEEAKVSLVRDDVLHEDALLLAMLVQSIEIQTVARVRTLLALGVRQPIAEARVLVAELAEFVLSSR